MPATLAALFFATCVLAPVAYMATFSGFRPYDDEGYFLVTIRDYLAGHALFTQALPIYGPFYYEVTAGLFKLLGAQPDHDSAGLVTIAVWLIASLIAGLTAYRLSRNPWIALTALLVAFRVLTALSGDPIQPAGLTSLLLACVACAASFRSGRPRLTPVLIGSAVAALCLVKINVGVFAGLAVCFASAASLSPRWRRFALPVVAFAMVAAPLALTAGLLGRPWVLELAVLVSLSAAGVGLAGAASPAASPPRAKLAWLAGGFVALSTGSIAVAFAGGTRPQDMLNAIVVLAAGFPTVFMVPLEIGVGFDVWAAIALAFALALLGPFRTVSVSPPTAALARIGAGLFILVSLLLLPASLWLLALPLAWIAVVRPQDAKSGGVDAYARLLLPALAAVESLQVYPVAGTQLSMAGFALVPVGVIALDDGIRQLRQAPASGRAGWIAPSAFAVNVAAAALFGVATASVYQAGSPLGLPGAERLRVPAAQAIELRGLVAAVDTTCASFITYPGMDSLYVWTGEQPPVELSSEVWWLVLSSDRQESIVAELQDRPRLCVVQNSNLVDFWAGGRPVPDRPLVRFIERQFTPAGTFGDYVLLVRSNR